MSTPNRSARKTAAITNTANKARTAVKSALGRSVGNRGKGPGYEVSKPGVRPDRPIDGSAAKRIARPSLGRSIGRKGRGPVYEVPKPVRPKPVKK